MRVGRQALFWVLVAVGVAAAIALARPIASRVCSNLAMAVVYAHAHAGDDVAPSRASLEDAERLLARAVALDASNRAAHRGLGFVLWERGAFEEAGSHWRRGGIPVGDFLRVASQAEREDVTRAMEWYRKAMAAWPGAGEPYVRAAILYENAKDWEAALALYERALATASFSSALMERRAHQGRGDALRNLGRPAEALPEYEWLVAHAPTYYWGYLRLAETVWQVQGDAERAEELYLQAITVDSQAKWAYRGLAVLYEATGRLQEAKTVYQKVLELDPEDALAKKRLERLNKPQ